MSQCLKTCSLCKKSTPDGSVENIFFGEWMKKGDLLVHYYCLLLSTHLPQNGNDNGGILGFLLRDIRQEIKAAATRKCVYCEDMNATIRCKKCRVYFHLTCGYTNYCVFHFVGEFNSFCHNCVELDDIQKRILQTKNTALLQCSICKQGMGVYVPTRWIYAKCCSNGFVHRICLQKYALNAGYYLKCIWCKEKEFRETVKYQGIFVPDRDANWEKEKGAFQDLYRGHGRCDMEVCNCHKGRNFTNGKKKLSITLITFFKLLSSATRICI